MCFVLVFFLKDFEETEDAYVGGNQVMVSSQVAGNVAKINADNMDKVHAGDILVELMIPMRNLVSNRPKAISPMLYVR